MIFKAFLYLWAFPNSAIGLLLALINRFNGGEAQIVNGVLEIHGKFITWFLQRCIPLKGNPLALTIGHVVLGVDHNILSKTRDHERIHVRQFERFGIFFLPLYLISTLLAWSRGKDPYRDNWFEQEAYSNSTIHL